MRKTWFRRRSCACGTINPTRAGCHPTCLVFSTIRFCGLNHHRNEKRRRKREDSIIYLNDFEDVWLDPACEDDEEA